MQTLFWSFCALIFALFIVCVCSLIMEEERGPNETLPPADTTDIIVMPDGELIIY